MKQALQTYLERKLMMNIITEEEAEIYADTTYRYLSGNIYELVEDVEWDEFSELFNQLLTEYQPWYCVVTNDYDLYDNGSYIESDVHEVAEEYEVEDVDYIKVLTVKQLWNNFRVVDTEVIEELSWK